VTDVSTITDAGAPAPVSEAPGADPQWWIDGDTYKCSACGRTRSHCIRRLPGKDRVCDDCHNNGGE
jgi:hypothetical protein